MYEKIFGTTSLSRKRQSMHNSVNMGYDIHVNVYVGKNFHTISLSRKRQSICNSVNKRYGIHISGYVQKIRMMDVYIKNIICFLFIVYLEERNVGPHCRLAIPGGTIFSFSCRCFYILKEKGTQSTHACTMRTTVVRGKLYHMF